MGYTLDKDGIKDIKYCDYVEITDVNDDEYIKKLPRTMEEAIKAFKEDSFIQNVIGNCLSEKIISRKNKEWKEYCRQVSSWEIDRYLDKI